MRRRLTSLVVLIVAASAGAAAQKRRAPKPPDLEVVEVAAHRRDGRVSVDGRIRNTSGKPIQGIVLLFDFRAPGRQTVTSQKTQLEEEVLAPGQEAVFRVQLVDPVRAVEFLVGAVDRRSRDLNVAKAGPYPIELPPPSFTKLLQFRNDS